MSGELCVQFGVGKGSREVKTVDVVQQLDI